MISFVETKLFTRLVQEYLSDDEYRALQQALLQDPEAGAVIPGAGGARKLRWGMAGRGKRGGLRVIYSCADAPRTNLDVDDVPEERDGEHFGSRSADKGRN
jgi:hypothetical protein